MFMPRPRLPTQLSCGGKELWAEETVNENACENACENSCVRMPGTKAGSKRTFSAQRRLRPGSAGQLRSNLVGVANDVGIAGMARRHALVSPPLARVVMHTCVLSMCMAPGLLSATGPVQEASGAGAKRRGSNARHQAATAFVASGLVREGSPCGGTGRSILAHSLPPHRSLGPRLGRCQRKDVLAGSLQHGGEATGAEACAWDLGPVQPEARQCRRAHEIAQQEYVDSLHFTDRAGISMCNLFRDKYDAGGTLGNEGRATAQVKQAINAGLAAAAAACWGTQRRGLAAAECLVLDGREAGTTRALERAGFSPRRVWTPNHCTGVVHALRWRHGASAFAADVSRYLEISAEQREAAFEFVFLDFTGIVYVCVLTSRMRMYCCVCVCVCRLHRHCGCAFYARYGVCVCVCVYILHAYSHTHTHTHTHTH